MAGKKWQKLRDRHYEWDPDLSEGTQNVARKVEKASKRKRWWGDSERSLAAKLEPHFWVERQRLMGHSRKPSEAPHGYYGGKILGTH